MHELKYKTVLTRDEMCLVHELLHDELMRFSTEALEKKTYAYSFVEVRKGGYDCLILYRGDEPFAPVDNSYDYLIFAYNDALQTVRYICCDSLEDGADQPYYLSLEW